MSIKGADHHQRIVPERAMKRSASEVIEGYETPEGEKNLGAGLESKVLSYTVNSGDVTYILRYLGSNDFTGQVNRDVYNFIVAFFRKYKN